MVRKKILDFIGKNRIKQADICRKSGLMPQQVSKILNGTRRLEIEEYIAICAALDVSVDKFLNDGEPPKPTRI